MKNSLTVEEAVAIMINFGYVPDGECVTGMLRYYLEESTFEYENYDGDDEFQLLRLKNRMIACQSRLKLASALKKCLLEDAIYTEETMIECVEDSTDENPVVTLNSLSSWASYQFGIDIDMKIIDEHNDLSALIKPKITSWEEVTVKIQANNRLSYKNGKDNYKHTFFSNINLIGNRKLGPNKSGYVLIGLCEGRKYPYGNAAPTGSDKVVITRLRTILKKLLGLSDDPFMPFNKYDGYRPRFKLIDDRKNADIRAKNEAIHVSFDTLRGNSDYLQYDDENDAADQFLRDNRK